MFHSWPLPHAPCLFSSRPRGFADRPEGRVLPFHGQWEARPSFIPHSCCQCSRSVPDPLSSSATTHFLPRKNAACSCLRPCAGKKHTAPLERFQAHTWLGFLLEPDHMPSSGRIFLIELFLSGGLQAVCVLLPPFMEPRKLMGECPPGGGAQRNSRRQGLAGS